MINNNIIIIKNNIINIYKQRYYNYIFDIIQKSYNKVKDNNKEIKNRGIGNFIKYFSFYVINYFINID